MTRSSGAVLLATAAAAWLTFSAAAQQPAAPAIHAKPSKRLVVRRAMVIYGNAKPPYGPADITIENGVITSIAGAAAGTLRDDPDATTIDAAGKYVMPGIVN